MQYSRQVQSWLQKETPFSVELSTVIRDKELKLIYVSTWLILKQKHPESEST